MVRVAVLGLGFMGTTHVRAIRSVPGAVLEAVYSADERKLAGDFSSVRGNLGESAGHVDLSGVKKYRALPELLADADIDAIDLCLPTDLHPFAIPVMQAGKHVLVEKPIALDGDLADRMVRESEELGRVLMVGHVLRFWPEYVTLQQQVRRPCSAAFRRQCGTPDWGGWLLQPQRSGGGVFDLVIHDVDYCLHLFGPPDHFTSRCSGQILEAEFRYADGVTASISGGWLPSADAPFRAEYHVTWDGGHLDFDSGTAPPPPAPDPYAAEIAYFIDCCEKGRLPERCPPRQSADAVKWMRRILESCQR
jgi:predicted dehydrogenase